MRLITILCPLFFLLSLTACKKSKVEPQPSPPTGIQKVKTETHNGSFSASYEYDGQGRRTLLTYANGSKYTYTYSGNTASEKSYDNTGTFINESIHQLNDSGFVIKTTYGAANISKTTYQYNASGQMVNQHFVSGPLSDSSDFFYYYSPQGRLDSIWFTRNNNSVKVFRQVFEYTLNKPNTYSHINTGLLYLGKAWNVNPYTKATIVNYPAGTQQVDLYSYEYDIYDRIVKQIYNGTDQSGVTYY